MEAIETAKESGKPFEVVVIATSAKEVRAHLHEPIGALKLAAMREFKIPPEKAPEYRLASLPGDPQAEFDDAKKVEDYHLHQGSKIYLTKPHNDA